MRLRAAILHLFAVVLVAVGILLHPASAPAGAAKTVPFVFSDLDGRPVRLADYRGQWVLVAFWAPWCPLCKIQMPALKQLNGRADLTVIGVGLDYDSPDALRTAVRQHGLEFPIVAGGARRSPDSPHRQVGPVDYFPTSYLYDPAGEIVMFVPGQVNARKLATFIDGRRAVAAGQPSAGPPTDRLAASMKREFGRSGEQAYADWRRLLDGLERVAERERPTAVNDFFNRRILQSTDQRIWGRADHWATLGEVLGKGAGDGEDFALAKYFTLLALGVPVERLRLVYVKTPDASDPVHIVLAYFPASGGEPLLLDNRQAEIRPASQRRDLTPVYSFNGAGVWGEAQDLAAGGVRPTLWEDTLRRARDEGFE